MKRALTMRRLPAFFIGFFLIQLWTATDAQTPDTLDPWSVSEQELLRWLRTEERLYDLKVRARMKTERYSEEQGMPLERYYEIARNLGDSTRQVFATQEELRIARRISRKIQEINRKLPEQSNNIMHQEDFTPERYNQLSEAIDRSTILRERIAKLMEFFSL